MVKYQCQVATEINISLVLVCFDLCITNLAEIVINEKKKFKAAIIYFFIVTNQMSM